MGYKPVCLTFTHSDVYREYVLMRCRSCIGHTRFLRILRRRLVCLLYTSSTEKKNTNMYSCAVLCRWRPSNIQHWYRCRWEPSLLVTPPIPHLYQSISILTKNQDKLPRNNGIHIHHGRSYCRSMLCFAVRWLDLSLGCGGWRTTVWAVVGVCCCLVEYDCLDDVLC